MLYRVKVVKSCAPGHLQQTPKWEVYVNVFRQCMAKSPKESGVLSTVCIPNTSTMLERRIQRHSWTRTTKRHRLSSVVKSWQDESI